MNFGCKRLTKSISAGVEAAEIEGTEKVDLEAEVRKFSSSRSNEEARVLKEFALSFINWRSASAESLTSLQPFEMKERAFSAVTMELEDDAVFMVVEFEVSRVLEREGFEFRKDGRLYMWCLWEGR